jgi:hypothetical protein
MKKNQRECKGCGAPLSDEEIKQAEERYNEFHNEFEALLHKYKLNPSERYNFSVAVALASIATLFDTRAEGACAFIYSLFKEFERDMEGDEVVGVRKSYE